MGWSSFQLRTVVAPTVPPSVRGDACDPTGPAGGWNGGEHGVVLGLGSVCAVPSIGHVTVERDRNRCEDGEHDDGRDIGAFERRLDLAAGRTITCMSRNIATPNTDAQAPRCHLAKAYPGRNSSGMRPMTVPTSPTRTVRRGP